jgi:hypothetical protein
LNKSLDIGSPLLQNHILLQICRIWTHIRTVCYISDHCLTQPLCYRSGQTFYRTTHIVSNPITFYYRPITLWNISRHISLRIKSRLHTYPNRVSYISDNIMLQIQANFIKDPNTLCKQLINTDLYHSWNGCFDPIWGLICPRYSLLWYSLLCMVQSHYTKDLFQN